MPQIDTTTLNKVLPLIGTALTVDVPDGTTVGGNVRGANAVDLQTLRVAATQVASGASSFVAGSYNSATGFGAASLGGGLNIASGALSATVGGQFAFTNGILGQCAFGHNSPALGRLQTTMTGLYQVTTGTTATRATADSTAASTANQLILRNNSAFIVEGSVIARDTVTNDCASFSFSVLVKRGSDAANTTIVGTPLITQDFADTAATTWAVTLTADTTNGALGVNVAGAGTNAIRWMIELYTQEVN